MTERGPLALCGSAFNGEQAVVFKSEKAVRRVEPAGFAFFLSREWQLQVPYEDMLRPRQIEHVDRPTIDRVEAYLTRLKVEQHDGKHVFALKKQWADILSEGTQTAPLTDRSEVGTDDSPKLQKAASRKCLGLVRDFVAKNQNAYELLNVCDSDDITTIKANYKKIVLLLHPDKAAHTRVPQEMAQYAAKYRLRNLCEEERKQQFLLLQDAFTIMSDPQLRHEYDCSLPFDENIPTKEQVRDAEDFFALFAPVFELNARWSNTKPVPAIGAQDATDDEVDAFYDFWRNFETTRTFSHAAPHLLDDAESREEKRWMERENLKVQKKLVKKEMVRIQKLVDLAQAHDPRLKARAERRRLEKIERQKQIEQETLRDQREREEAEARRRDELERSLNREKFEKQIVKKLRQHIRAIGAKLPNGAELSQHFDRLSELDYEFVKEACQDIYALIGHATQIEGCEESLQFVKRMDAIVKSAVLSDPKPYEEVLLRVSAQISPPVVSAATEVKEAKRTDAEEDAPAPWTPDELSRLSKAVELHVAGVTDRWSLIAKHVKTKTAAQCIQMAREVAAGKRVATGAANSASSSVVYGEMWSAEQQSEFEAALSKYPSSLDPATRWRMIASEVQGKTPKECLSRFKMIKATIAAAATRNSNNTN
ncbi:myb-like DNA-binding/DnaJ domain containing protein, putative [Babesia bigemina]|uniref:Myb-like DNA-binding/DnaJ domain containing protein, putative n=1 Tax=Babesia bigemina TaxID=5866 RepID=A0A061D4P2_BABBI|nr:myb-like DNA-binding/DnaJ domain containing protein, putative [Babesia bigemina]CDR95017.1 myb-like DNA-binding/DnaJ domain containing protein, putative [Babesia bigemina]|eukprot:XP_012767203.1 myb-like DNA-binding/DnaJ domain containing protein, putative [Babesia bigemina]